MSHDATIQSLDLQMTGSSWPSLASVKVNLSNGQSSPVIVADGQWRGTQDYLSLKGEETITFDPDVPVRAVDAVTLWQSIGSLQFYDGNDELIADYDPVDAPAIYRRNNAEYIRTDSRYELADNEELVGVYGIVDYYSSLSQFGFVVKVKPDVPAVGGCPSDATVNRKIQSIYGNNVSGF